MTKESEQYNNVKWLFDFLSTPLSHALSDNVNIVKMISTELYSTFDRTLFFSKTDAYNNNFSKLDMQFFFEADRISYDSIEYLKNFFDSNDLIIAYELSKQTREVFDKAGLRYVDIWLHPVRYLDDLIYGFYSNVGLVNDELKRFDIDKELYYSYANLIKVGMYKGYKRVDAKVKSNSLIFVGQTQFDKAVFSKGKMLNALDYKAEIEELAKTHDHVYYLRHPFVKNGDEEIFNFFKSLPNYTEFLGAPNSYAILSDPEARTFCTISSSLAIEARFFGKESILLHRPVIDIDNEYSSIHQDFLFSHFWSKVLKSLFDVIERPKLEFFNPHCKIRDSLSSYWSYREIDKLELAKKTIGVVYNKVK